jgi:Ca2+-binding RTX toxin-like protein
VVNFVFIDSRVSDRELLLASLDPGTQVVVLDAGQDGLAQIAQALQGRTDLDLIQIFSHGSEGTLVLGASAVSGENINSYQEELAAIGAALGENGDILLYGCDVAGGETGQAFIDQLAALTGADVAASVDATGSSLAGGDWTLEVSTGAIEANSALSTSAQESYAHLLATVNGTTGNDSSLAGTTGDDTISGLAGNDTLIGLAGNDLLDGGVGIDRVNYSGASGGYSFGRSGSHFSVTDADSTNGSDGVDTLIDIENAAFTGSVVTLSGEFRVNNTVADVQQYPSVAALPDGGYLVVWESNLQDGSGYGVYAQRYGASGATVGGEFRVNSTTVDAQKAPAVSVLEGGGFVVAWQSNLQDGGLYGIYGQRFDTNGQALGGEFRVNGTTPSTQEAPAIAALEGGGFVVTWHGNGVLDSNGVFARRYDADGSALGDELRLNTVTANDQSLTAVAALDGGGFVAVWRSNLQDASGYGVYAQRIGADGQALGPEFRVNTTTSGVQETPAVAALAEGGFVVAWQGSGALDGSGVFAQRYGANGAALGAEFRVNTTTANVQAQPTIAALAAGGGFVIAWHDSVLDAGYGVYAQRYDVNGVPQGGEFRANTTSSSTQYYPSVAALSDGGFLLTWASYQDSPTSYGIYAQRFDAAGNKVMLQVTGDAAANALVWSDAENVALSGLAGNDSLSAGAGDDTLNGGTNDDLLSGGAGLDTASYDAATSAVTVNLAVAIAQNTLGAGSDTLVSIEHLNGGAYADTLTGNPEANRLTGLAGNDTLAGGAGNDTLDGSTGLDTASYASSTGAVAANLSTGLASDGLGSMDTLLNLEHLTGSDQGDQLSGDAAGNLLQGGLGDDTLVGGLGNDTLNGGTGIDRASYADSASALSLSLALATAQAGTGGAGSDTLLGIEQIEGGAHNDSLTGSANADMLLGGLGADTLNGALGNDVLIGGVGNDALDGSAGDDILEGDAGDDVLAGADGWDRASYAHAESAVAVNLALLAAQNTLGAGSDSLTFIEELEGGAYNDSLTGSAAANRLLGGAGDDSIVGGAGNDTLEGGAGIDTMDGGQGIDRISHASAAVGVTANLALLAARFSNFEELEGSAFNDTLLGDGNANRLFGLDGDDTLTGASGADLLLGGPGQDRALFSGLAAASSVAQTESGALLVTGPDGADGLMGVETLGFADATVQVSFAAGPAEFRVNSYSAGAQTASAVAALPDGGWVVAWTSEGQDGSGAGVYGQRYSAAGATVGDEFAINTTKTSTQDGPALTALADGGWVVAWQSYQGGSYNIYWQRFASNGQATGTEHLVNTRLPDSQIGARVQPLNDGGWVVIWQSYYQEAANNWGIYGQRYDANGAAVLGEFHVNTNAGQEVAASVAVLADGGWVVVWERETITQIEVPLIGTITIIDRDVHGRRYDASGGSIGAEFRVNTNTAELQTTASVVALADGGWVIAWQSLHQDDGSYDIYAQRYGASGAKVGGEFLVNTVRSSHQASSSIAALPDGGWLVVWQSAYQDGSLYGVYGQRYDAAGVKEGLEFRINSYVNSEQRDPSVTVLADGGWVVTWQSNLQDGSGYGIYGQRFDAQGNALIGGLTLLVTGNGSAQALLGYTGADTLHGLGGADTLDGAGGADSMLGGAGSDRYQVDNVGDVVNELLDQGLDLVLSAVTYTLSINVENLTLTGAGAIHGTGNDQPNLLTGGDGNNSLSGVGGNDTLVGGTGNDTLIGGAGDDLYFVADAGDLVSEAPEPGDDLVSASISYALTPNVERLTLTGFANLIATGNPLPNTLTGNSGANTLDGGAGNDTLTGGAGDDLFVVGLLNGADLITDFAGADGIRVVGAPSQAFIFLDGLDNSVGVGAGVVRVANSGSTTTLYIGLDVIPGADLETFVSGVLLAKDLRKTLNTDTIFLNHAPTVATPLPNRNAMEDSDFSFTFSAAAFVDVDPGDLFSYTAAGLPGWLQFNAATRTFSGIPRNDDVGSVNVTVTATDNWGASVSDVFQITVANTNDAPVVELAISQKNAAVSSPFELLASDYITDPDRDALAWNAAAEGGGSLPSWLAIDPATGRFSGTAPAWDLGSSYSLRVTATDPGGQQASTVFGLAVVSASSGGGLNVIVGDAGNNSLPGTTGDDSIDGGPGADTMAGSLGDDIYVVDVADDMVVESGAAGSDLVRASVDYALTPNVENLRLTETGDIDGTGNLLPNQMFGNAGANRLDGGQGSDTLDGDAGHDTYVVDSPFDLVVEAVLAGSDTIEAGVAYDISATSPVSSPNVEAITLTGELHIGATGNDLPNMLTGNPGDNTLVGGDGDDTLFGGDGNDSLDGGLGADRMEGGAGDDIYTVDNLQDSVTEALDAGTDTVLSSVDWSLEPGLGDNVENLMLTGDNAIDGTGNALSNQLIGNAADNVLTGGAGDDLLKGADTLNGNTGADTLRGGTGNDTYYIDSTTDLVEELAGEGSADKIYTSVSITLLENNNVEQVFTIDANALFITGNGLNNFFQGSNGADSLDGGAGDDEINAGVGDDTIVGGTGADTMLGGAGEDQYFVDDAGDRVVEINNTPATGLPLATWLADLYAGVRDRVNSTVNFVLSEYLEDLILAGIANLEGTGNALRNGMRGNDGDNLLLGFGERDTLEGGLGDDVLDGGTGADSMEGGAGDDTYYVDSLEDMVVEQNNTAATGTPQGDGLEIYAGVLDRVNTRVNFTLGAFLEDLVQEGLANLQGTGNGLRNSLQGNDGNNVLSGLGDFDTLAGGLGHDSLDGGDGDDQLAGGGGNDTLVGGQGSDRAIYAGNRSDFTASFDATNNRHVLVSLAEGTDFVSAVETFQFADQVVAAGDLVVALAGVLKNGTDAPDILVGGEGNDTLDGRDGNDTLRGETGNDSMDGGAGLDSASYQSASAGVSVNLAIIGPQATGPSGEDRLIAIENLIGGIYADSLAGSTGANQLDGGDGIDSMSGGDGADIYFVRNAGDLVIESSDLAAGGNDTALAYYGGYVLTANVENGRIMFAGSGGIAGNAGNNVLYAGPGSNVITGGLGQDTASYLYAMGPINADLATADAQATGGSGSDSFVGIENLTGSAFNDSLIGNTAANILDGGAGTDAMTGGDGADTYLVREATDSVSETNAAAAGGVDLVWSYLGSYTLGSNVENGRIMATGAADLAGNALSNTLYPGVGNNVLTADAGVDTLSYAYMGAAALNAGVTANLATGQASGTSGIDTFTGFENLTGSNFNDSITGDAGANILDGGLGVDTMVGGDGNDTYLIRNGGDIASETSADGGASDIALVYYGGYTLTANVENGRIMAYTAANINGNGLNNLLIAGINNNVINGAAGNDTASYLFATAAVNASLATGLASGGSGSDSFTSIENLTGSNFNDTLAGDGTANLLTGGTGADTLTGGAGADIFDYNSEAESGITNSTWDRITDFQTGQGDKIDLSGIDANTTIAGNQTFLTLTSGTTFSATTTFTAANRLFFDTTADVLYGNLDADAAAEFAIELVGVNALALTDLLG